MPEPVPIRADNPQVPEIAFQVIVYVNGQMEYKCQTTGQPAIDELILRGWLDKIRDEVLASAARRGRIVV